MSKNNDDQSNDFLSQWEAFKKEFLNDADDADFTSPYSSMHPHPADGSDDDGHTSDYTYESSASSRAHDDADNASDKGGDGKHADKHSDKHSDKHDDEHADKGSDKDADKGADKGKKKARKSSHSGESEFAQQIGLVKDITHELKELGWGSGFWGKWFWIIIAVLAVIALIIWAGVSFGTDLLWYNQLGFSSVLWVTWFMKIGLWVVYALLVGIVGFLAANWAIVKRPADENGDSYKYDKDGVTIIATHSMTSRRLRHISLWVSLIIGIIFGSQLMDNWNDILLMFHAQPFHQRDPQFGFDVGFYVFVLPGLRALIAGMQRLLFLALIASVVAHLVSGGIRFSVPDKHRSLFAMTKSARRQLAFWAFLLLGFTAVQILLGAFDSLTQTDDKFTGAGYTGTHVTIPAIIFAAVLVFAFALFFAIWLNTTKAIAEPMGEKVGFKKAMTAWKTPVIVLAIFVVLGLLAQVAAPKLLQSLVVNPNQQELESTYIQRNISATQKAFGLDKVEKVNYNATTTGKAGALASDAETTAQIRLLDPQVVAPTFRQLQQSKQYYSFQDTQMVDKYMIDGKSYDTVIGARELNLDGNDSRNWVNDHTVYTHGYGVVAAYGNRISKDGQPVFFEKGIPTQGKLTDSQHYEPRIYFSPNAPEYSIVGHEKGQKDWEFDYPSGSEGKLTEFTGNGGPKISNPFLKLIYSIKFGSLQMFFSDRVNSNSQILYRRSPVERVHRVAPYLEIDSRVYPAVVDGRVKWVLDAYTVSDQYPYSQKVDLHNSTQDALTQSSKTMKTLVSGEANYMRNSVKATVDAYDGHVDLYAWDSSDPVLKAWQSIFPHAYKPLSKISGDLMSHMRYPESLFKVQRKLLSTYHVTDAAQFFSGEDFWQVPTDPTLKANAAESGKQVSAALQSPYYLTMQTPNRKSPTFSLYTSFIPAGRDTREILTGYLSADSDAGNKAGVIGKNYGTLRLLELPKSTNVPGPGQAQNNFNASATVSRELNLLESGSTNVVRGNLLTLPIGGGLIYIQPVYVESSGTTRFPLLKKVLVAFGEHIGFADTLDEALDQVFGGDSGALAGDADNKAITKKTGQNGQNGQNGDANSGQDGQNGQNGEQSNAQTQQKNKQLTDALNDANKALNDADAALKAGDWSAYGKAQEALKEAIKRAAQEQ